MAAQVFKYNNAFRLESGAVLPSVEIAYHTYGTFDSGRSKVVWICHALTANSDCADWWGGLVGPGKVFDPEEYFIVCANILSSCYGSSGPLSINPATGKKYYSDFPFVTIRDMVNAHILLRKHLGIERIYAGAGGSMGAYQLLEWAIMEDRLFEQLVLTTTSARESAWGIAIHTAQRLAIEADPGWRDHADKAGAKGLKAARAIGMLTYRNYEAFGQTQTDEDTDKLDNFRASSYINHQGDKLVNRFHAYSYWLLTKSMDSHNVGRGRGTAGDALKRIKARTLVVGISSDFLCPVAEQQYLARHIPDAEFREITSPFGHDGFLVESDKLSALIRAFFALAN
ncbi:MAG: homoserine O-acetyltransferase [Bacteroidota bacterium]